MAEQGEHEVKVGSLADLVELAMTRHEVIYVTDLERIARQAGHKINRTTITQLRTGTYNRRPGRAVLEALAYLANVNYQTVLKLAGLGGKLAPFASQIPPDADLLTPRQREVLLSLIRVMIDTQRAIAREDPEVQGSEVLGITDEDLNLGTSYDRPGDNQSAG